MKCNVWGVELFDGAEVGVKEVGWGEKKGFRVGEGAGRTRGRREGKR